MLSLIGIGFVFENVTVTCQPRHETVQNCSDDRHQSLKFSHAFCACVLRLKHPNLKNWSDNLER